MASTDYHRGYEAAYTEIYAAIDSEHHPVNCGNCRACGVMRAVLEDAFARLGEKMTPEEFDALAGIIAVVNGREEAARECGT